MTTYSKRRAKRSLAAIVAAMLMASVLAVVAGSPAQAANTAFEVKVDHDNNAATDTVREFAGQDRYDTALRVAKNFATSKGGLGAVPVAFVASGNTLVDSISVAGFAGYADAPILLTPRAACTAASLISSRTTASAPCTCWAARLRWTRRRPPPSRASTTSPR